MFRRKATCYGAPRIRRIRDWLYPFAVGVVLLSLAGVDLYRGQTQFRRILISAADDPLIYWPCILFFGALGLSMLRVAFSQCKKWRGEIRKRRNPMSSPR